MRLLGLKLSSKEKDPAVCANKRKKIIHLNTVKSKVSHYRQIKKTSILSNRIKLDQVNIERLKSTTIHNLKPSNLNLNPKSIEYQKKISNKRESMSCITLTNWLLLMTLF